MNYTNWKTIVGALFMVGGGMEMKKTWYQFHSFAPAFNGSLILTIMAVGLFVWGANTKKEKKFL